MCSAHLSPALLRRFNGVGGSAAGHVAEERASGFFEAGEGVETTHLVPRAHRWIETESVADGSAVVA